MIRCSRFIALTVALAIAVEAGVAWPRQPDPAAAVCSGDPRVLPVVGAPLLDVGSYRGARVSANPRAQHLFAQAMVFGWGFNFPEAVRSFRAAALADPDCALCHWGIAWALGPSINHDMRPEDVPVAIDALTQARARAPDIGSRERALIDALATRYRNDPSADPSADPNADALARAYADAMRKLAARRPDDADIAVLAVEAVMNAHPYDYWRTDGRPRPWTKDIVTLLDRAERLAPDHPGAHHYRIHLFEDSPTPERALVSSQRLGEIAPAVGHLVHMPSHIYLRIGRYHDAVRVNRAAVDADRAYVAAVQMPTRYAADYLPHNVHFLWASALWSGESAVAFEAAQQLEAADQLSDEPARRGMRQHLQATPWLTLVRFQRWDELLARAFTVDRDAPYLAGLVHFTRGMALAAQRDAAAAQAEADALRAAIDAARAQRLTIKNINAAADVLAVAHRQLLAELAAARGSSAEAIRHATAAVAAEDRLAGDEPPAWQIPSRHALGRLLLEGGRAAEARAIYRADLQRHPNNAWALNGLATAEERLGRAAQAAAARHRAELAWTHADGPLPYAAARAQRAR